MKEKSKNSQEQKKENPKTSRSDQRALQVVGFVFNHSLSQVLLIRKNRPDWQKRKLNGIGGNVSLPEDKADGFTCIDYGKAFVREAKEEAGLVLDKEKLVHIGFTDLRKKHAVEIFTYRLDGYPVLVQQTDETIIWMDPFKLPLTLCVPDVLFLVPFARHVLATDNLRSATVMILYK